MPRVKLKIIWIARFGLIPGVESLCVNEVMPGRRSVFENWTDYCSVERLSGFCVIRLTNKQTYQLTPIKTEPPWRR